MSLEANNFKISEPDYFHREYKNDLPQEESGNYYVDQCKRITSVALPFLSLYKPFGFTLSLTLGGLRSFTSLSQLLTEIQNGGLNECSYALLQTLLSVIALTGTILAHPFGMLITTVHDCALDCFAVGNNLYLGNFQGAIGNSANLMNNTLYLALFLHGGLEIAIASLAMQILIGLSQSASEYQKGNYLEASGHMLMGMIRGNQLGGQVRMLQMKWEIEKVLNKPQARSTASFQLKSSAEICPQQVDKEMVIKAATSENSELIHILVKYSNNPDGLPSLLYAAKLGDFKAVKLLLQYDANLFTKDSSGNTALPYAMFSKNTEMVKFFLNKGIDPNTGICFSSGIWCEVIKQNDVKSFEVLISHGLKLNSVYYDDFNAPAFNSIQFGSLDLLKLILDHGGDVPKTLWCLPNPALWAVSGDLPEKRKEKFECFKWLVAEKILILNKEDDFNIPNSYPEFVEYLLDHGYININQKSLLQLSFNKPDVLRLVIQKGADIKEGHTVLHDAVSAWGWISVSYLESIKILIESGVNVNSKDSNGQTPLAKAKDKKIKDLLIKYGAV